MSGFSFDSNIIIDALAGFEQARSELERATSHGSTAWISRVVWIEVMSKGEGEGLIRAEKLMSGLGMDEVDAEIARRAAALRRERTRLKAMDAIILATAQCHGLQLATRNVRDFPLTLDAVLHPYSL